MISLQNIIPNIEQRLPPLVAGETHCFVVQSSIWADFFIEHISMQQSTLVLGTADTVERMQRYTSDLLSNKNLHLAEWKHSRWLRPSSLLRSIAQAAAGSKVIVFNVNYRELSAVEQALCNRTFLLRLKNWASANGKLLIFTLQAEIDNPDLREFLNTSARAFGSLHMIYQGQPNWRWLLQYWFRGYTINRWNWELEEQRLPNGGITFEFVNHDNFASDTRRLGEKAPRFICDAGVDEGEFLPSEWQKIVYETDLRDELPQGSDALVILGISSRDKLLQVAERVFQLRKYFGPYLRIIVRERDESLRLQDERILISSGANLVLPSELGTRRVIGVAETTVGFKFTHTLPDNFADIKTSQIMDDVRGYLAPGMFLDKVLTLEKKAERQALDSVLIRAEPGTGLTAHTLVRRFSSRRPGDIISVLQGQVYLYLYGCRESDVSNVLYMNFGIPSDNLFKNEVRIVKHGQIIDARDGLVEDEHAAPSPVLDIQYSSRGESSVTRKVVEKTAPGVRKADFL
ncbi:BcsE family c-di-GMP-binding protein [Aliidiomarina iranensis]|uniref:BcsE family c-di-GMP-binding protein n=1 Tax=Aliidiomarina iranensis TaxID=1434071 RepID=UPI0013009A35|nr:BcsE family c-di-GMP-binding protein [Aliidiomarina iranensis]